MASDKIFLNRVIKIFEDDENPGHDGMIIGLREIEADSHLIISLSLKVVLENEYKPRWISVNGYPESFRFVDETVNPREIEPSRIDVNGDEMDNEENQKRYPFVDPRRNKRYRFQNAEVLKYQKYPCLDIVSGTKLRLTGSELSIATEKERKS